MKKGLLCLLLVLILPFTFAENRLAIQGTFDLYSDNSNPLAMAEDGDFVRLNYAKGKL